VKRRTTFRTRIVPELYESGARRTWS